jgi:phosphoenolpyruvate carboxykinase (ATP)
MKPPRKTRRKNDCMNPTSAKLAAASLSFSKTYRNPRPAALYELAVGSERARIVSSGALAASSGERTGRSPGDKRIVRHPVSERDVWWGTVNVELSEASFEANRERALAALDGRPYVYVVDGYAGWDVRCRLKVRIVCAQAYHALFMYNMLIRPSPEELERFGDPEFIVYNAGFAAADPSVPGVTSTTSVSVSFERGEMVILGTEYAGEMKKGIFTVMNYLMPRRDVLSMHCSANEGDAGDVSLFFGLSGTGKTTLSADPERRLIGDDEHGWTDNGIFNIEGGCYAKCIDLSREREPEIYDAIRFGSVLENVVFDDWTRDVDYSDTSVTENTRCSYPIEFIPNAKVPCVGGHPRNILLLTCDAFGVLPPVSKLSPEQAMYHFISGYTAKVAGTEMGVTDPEATFSACFGAAFLVWHPTKYAEMLAERIRRHGSEAWLVNTGWSGGAYGVGARIRLDYTRAIIHAIHSGELGAAPTAEDPTFGLAVPTQCPDVPAQILVPQNTWSDASEYRKQARKLAGLFDANFQRYADLASERIRAAGPTRCA